MNPFLKSLKTAFIDPFKKTSSLPVPTLKQSITPSTNNLMSVAPKQPVYPTPTGKPTTPAPQYNSQNMPLLEAKVGPSTFANVPKTPTVAPKAPVTPKPVATSGAPVINPQQPTTQSGQYINPATGGVSNTPAPTPAPVAPTAPATPNIADIISKYETEYKGNLAPTAEEIAASEELSRLSDSFRTGYQNIEDQTIPMQFITGQQRSLEKRALNLTEPLKDKLARLQAKRASALEASKFALERADTTLKTQKEANKPTTLSAGETIGVFDPTTGTFKSSYTAPKETAAGASPDGFSLSPGQTRYDAFGNIIASAKDLEAEKAKAQTGQATQSVIDIVDSLIGSDTNAISGLPSVGAFIPGTAAQKTKNLYEQLKGMLALQNRQQLKGSGAISDFEAKVLERAASSLGRNLSDTDFRATLTQLRKDLVDARNQALASGWTPGNTSGSNSNNVFSEQW